MPEAWALQSVPGRPRARDQRLGDRGRDRRVGAGEVVPVPGHRARRRAPSGRTGCPCRGRPRWRRPRCRSGSSARPGRSMPEAARMAAPRPRAAMFGHVQRAGAALVRRGPRRRPGRCGRGCWRPRRRRRRRRGRRRSRPKSMTSRMARGIRRSARGSAASRAGARRRGVGGAEAGLGGGERGRVGGVDAGERRVGLDRGAEAEQVLEADGVVDAVAGRRRPPPSSTTAKPRARVSMAATKPSRPAVTSAISGAPARCASKSSRKSVGPPRAATMRSKRSAAAPEAKASAHLRRRRPRASGARPDWASSSAPSATVTS